MNSDSEQKKIRPGISAAERAERLAAFDEMIRAGEAAGLYDDDSSVPESPSVSNNHPAADKPGVQDMPAVAGLNTGDAAAFNGGYSSENSAHPAIFLPSLQTLQIAEYSDFDGFEVTLALLDHCIDGDGMPVESQCRFTVLNSLTLPAALIGTLQDILRKVAPITLTDFAAEQNPDGTYDGSTVEKMYADISRLKWELYATELCLADMSRDSIVGEPSSSDNPRIFFADEPRPSIWNLFSSEIRTAIERFAHNSTGNDSHEDELLASQGITLELAHDSAAGWHDTNPIVRVRIDGNEWHLEFEEGIASEDASGNEDDSGSEDNENEDDEERQPEAILSIGPVGQKAICFASKYRAQLKARGFIYAEAKSGYLVVDGDAPGAEAYLYEIVAALSRNAV